MTSKERVRAAINWKSPDRIPVHESFWTDTIELWKKQGLPEQVGMYPSINPAETADNDGLISVEEFFDMDIAPVYLDSSPRFEQKIVSRNGEYYTYDDRWGYRAVKPWMKSGSIHYESTVTNDPDTWNQTVKPKMVLMDHEPARIDDRSYFEHFEAYPSWNDARRKIERIKLSERYVLVFNYGPWEAAWRHRGFSRAMMDIALTPDWFEDMIWTHFELTKSIIEKSAAEGIRPDGYIMVDDLGSSTAPLISPTMFRDVLKPVYIEIGKLLKSLGIDFWLHSCGNVEMLIDDYLECGVRVLNPLQFSAGMDAIEFAGRYKEGLAFYGNLDARLLSGEWDPLKTAIDERCEAFSEGGWVFHSDHSVPPDMSYSNFCKMLRYVKDRS